jgi:Ras family
MKQYATDLPVITLVGSKLDLTSLRQVTKDEVEELAKAIGAK